MVKLYSRQYKDLIVTNTTHFQRALFSLRNGTNIPHPISTHVSKRSTWCISNINLFIWTLYGKVILKALPGHKSNQYHTFSNAHFFHYGMVQTFHIQSDVFLQNRISQYNRIFQPTIQFLTNGTRTTENKKKTVATYVDASPRQIL